MKTVGFSTILPKGSVLVFSLLILSILLVTSLTILSAAFLDRKTSLSTGSSARSFQVADSGVEEVLYQIYKVSPASLDALAGNLGVVCNSGTISFATAGGTATVAFYQDEMTVLTDCAATDWRDRVVKIKSEGVAGSTTRAVEVAVAATSSPMESKAWVSWSGGSILAESNVSSVTNGSMNPMINFENALPSAQYAVVCNSTLGAGVEEQVFAYNRSTTSFMLRAAHASGADAITAFDCVVFGN